MEELSTILLYIAAFGYAELFLKHFQVNTNKQRLMFYSIILFLSFLVNSK